MQLMGLESTHMQLNLGRAAQSNCIFFCLPHDSLYMGLETTHMQPIAFATVSPGELRLPTRTKTDPFAS